LASGGEESGPIHFHLASGDWQPVPKCVPFFLFLLPRRNLHFSKQLHFSLLSPCNLASPFFLFLLPRRSLHFSLLSPYNLPLHRCWFAGSLPPLGRCRRWVVATAGSLPPLGRCRRWFAAAAGSLHLHFLIPWLNFICSF